GLIEVLKAVEERFGGDGHGAARDAVNRVGAHIAEQMIDGVEIPPDISRIEAARLFASWIDEVAYASIEKPRMYEGSADFDIHYCPHEDVYGAFDCRVQRYLVEGMIDAGKRL